MFFYLIEQFRPNISKKLMKTIFFGRFIFANFYNQKRIKGGTRIKTNRLNRGKGIGFSTGVRLTAN